MSPGTTLSPLGYRLFATVWIALLASQMANSIQGVGAQWLMTAIDGRADMVGLIHTATSLPIMLLALVGGAIADLYDRRTVMLAAQLCIATGSLLLALLAWTGTASPWILIALTLFVGTGLAFFQPAVNASIPTLLPRGEISAAVGLNVTSFNVARTVGPAIGGLIVAVGGAFAAFVVSAVFTLLSVSVLLGWRPPPSPPRPTGGRLLSSIAEGLRITRATPQLRAIAIRALCTTFCGASLWGLMPLVARDIVGGGPERFGLLLGALGFGALVGSLASHEFRRRFTPESLARMASVAFGGAAILIAFRPGLAVTLVALAVGGAFWVQALSGFSVSAQIWAPRELVGRVTSTVSVSIWGGLAIGSWFWGHVAEWTSLVTAIAASGAALLAVMGLGLVTPLPRNDIAPDSQRPAIGK